MKRLRLFLLLCIALCMTSCNLCRFCKQSTIIEHDTIVHHIDIYDTVQVQIADTLHSSGQNIIYGADTTYKFMFDSLQMQNALKDKRISSLLSQIVNNKLYIAPITKQSKYATATAGVTDNALWLDLILDDITYVNHSSIDSVAITNNSTTVVEQQKHNSVWRNMWFYTTILFSLFAIVLAIGIVKLINHH